MSETEKEALNKKVNFLNSQNRWMGGCLLGMVTAVLTTGFFCQAQNIRLPPTVLPFITCIPKRSLCERLTYTVPTMGSTGQVNSTWVLFKLGVN